MSTADNYCRCPVSVAAAKGSIGPFAFGSLIPCFSLARMDLSMYLGVPRPSYPSSQSKSPSNPLQLIPTNHFKFCYASAAFMHFIFYKTSLLLPREASGCSLHSWPLARPAAHLCRSFPSTVEHPQPDHTHHQPLHNTSPPEPSHCKPIAHTQPELCTTELL